MTEPWFSQLGYLPFVLLSAVGVYLMLSHRNFLRALVGLQVLQTGVILFFVLMAVREGATIPILPEAEKAPAHAAPHEAALVHEDDQQHGEQANGREGDRSAEVADKADGPGDVDHAKYDLDAPIENPIPQALMLTAIVVGVATQGVGLAILRQIRNETGSIEDPLQQPDDATGKGAADV